MKIAEHSSEDVTILDLNGKLIRGESQQLQEVINSLVSQGRKKVVLNLAEVPDADNTGIGELVRTYTATTRMGGGVRLVNPTPKFSYLLEVTNLKSVFEPLTCQDETEAVRSFVSEHKPRAAM